MKTFTLSPLPPSTEIETPAVLRQLIKSHQYLAELKDIEVTASLIRNGVFV